MTRLVKGMTLSECLIGLFLSSIILSVLMNQLLAVKKNYQVAETQIQAELELHLLSDWLRDSIRQAGFTPCSGLSRLVTPHPIKAIEFQAEPLPELIIRRMKSSFDLVDKIEGPTQLLLKKAPHLPVNRPFLIADCTHAEWVEVAFSETVFGKQRIQLKAPLQYEYHAPIYWGEWLNEHYFIRQKGNQKSLYYGLTHPEELMPGVNGMTVHLESQTETFFVSLVLTLKDRPEFVLSAQVRAP